MSFNHLIPASIRGWLFWRRVRVLSFFKRAGHALGLGRLTWKMSLPSEVSFWEDYIRTRGGNCHAEEEFTFRTAADSELQPWLREWLNVPDGTELRALDVGAGPLTWIGKKWGDRRLHIVAVDPLADSYNTLMDRYGIQPPVRTECGNGEDIVARFGAQAFDLVFARNSLDHSFDAIRAVTSIVEVAKPGGVIFLWHNPDEAEGLDYQGLHQWNFRLENGELIVWRGTHKLNVNRELAEHLTVLRCELHEGMIQAVFRKRCTTRQVGLHQ